MATSRNIKFYETCPARPDKSTLGYVPAEGEMTR